MSVLFDCKPLVMAKLTPCKHSPMGVGCLYHRVRAPLAARNGTPLLMEYRARRYTTFNDGVCQRVDGGLLMDPK